MADPWKFFLVELTYQVPEEKVNEVVAEHRAYLQVGYERGWLLLSGPQRPLKGGVIIARAPSREALEEYFAQDPFQMQGVASYRFVEFNPVKRQGFLETWINGEV